MAKINVASELIYTWKNSYFVITSTAKIMTNKKLQTVNIRSTQNMSTLQ